MITSQHTTHDGAVGEVGVEGSAMTLRIHSRFRVHGDALLSMRTEEDSFEALNSGSFRQVVVRV